MAYVHHENGDDLESGTRVKHDEGAKESEQDRGTYPHTPSGESHWRESKNRLDLGSCVLKATNLPLCVKIRLPVRNAKRVSQILAAHSTSAGADSSANQGWGSNPSSQNGSTSGTAKRPTQTPTVPAKKPVFGPPSGAVGPKVPPPQGSVGKRPVATQPSAGPSGSAPAPTTTPTYGQTQPAPVNRPAPAAASSSTAPATTTVPPGVGQGNPQGRPTPPTPTARPSNPPPPAGGAASNSRPPQEPNRAPSLSASAGTPGARPMPATPTYGAQPKYPPQNLSSSSNAGYGNNTGANGYGHNQQSAPQSTPQFRPAPPTGPPGPSNTYAPPPASNGYHAESQPVPIQARAPSPALNPGYQQAPTSSSPTGTPAPPPPPPTQNSGPSLNTSNGSIPASSSQDSAAASPKPGTSKEAKKGGIFRSTFFAPFALPCPTFFGVGQKCLFPFSSPFDWHRHHECTLLTFGLLGTTRSPLGAKDCLRLALKNCCASFDRSYPMFSLLLPTNFLTLLFLPLFAASLEPPVCLRRNIDPFLCVCVWRTKTNLVYPRIVAQLLACRSH